MATLQELVAQKEQLEREIETTRKSEREGALNQVRTLMREYGLSVSDLTQKSPAVKTGSGKGTKVAPKYRDARTGDTWSGRGLQPKWLKAALTTGQKIEDFAL
ncbi:MAG: H-NS histone family protein [Burkholderiaceae bacterium]